LIPVGVSFGERVSVVPGRYGAAHEIADHCHLRARRRCPLPGLAWRRGDHDEDVHLASGAALEGFAGDGTGGTYFFCGDGGEERPVLYADSEGGAALVAIGLPELLRLLLVAPWWRDCRAFTAEESGELAAGYVEDMPDLVVRRDRAATALGLDLPTEADVLARLREVVTEAGRTSS
jgi:hypothetical protein